MAGSDEQEIGTVTVTDEPTLIRPAKASRESLTLRNTDEAEVVKLIKAGQAFADGFPLLGGTGAGEAYRYDDYKGAVYAIADSGQSAIVAYTEVG